MENIGKFIIPANWVNVEDLGATFQDGTTYQIENSGIGYVILQVSANLPSEQNSDGQRLDPTGFKIAYYKIESGKHLYAKLDRNSESAAINISTVEV